MRPDIVVFIESSIDNYLRLLDALETFGVQNFLAKNSVEPFIVSIFPRVTQIDLDRFYAYLFKHNLEGAQ